MCGSWIARLLYLMNVVASSSEHDFLLLHQWHIHYIITVQNVAMVIVSLVATKISKGVQLLKYNVRRIIRCDSVLEYDMFAIEVRRFTNRRNILVDYYPGCTRRIIISSNQHLYSRGGIEFGCWAGRANSLGFLLTVIFELGVIFLLLFDTVCR